jgi:O-antigen/teichoic acid export membrane protein
MRKRLQIKLDAIRANHHLWEVMKGASLSLMIQVVGSMLGLAVSITVARMLGAEGSGVYYLAISVATIAATVSRVGFDNTVVRFVASHASVQEWGAVRKVYRTAMIVVAAVSLVITVVLFLGAGWIANSLFDKPYMVLPLRLVALSILPLSFAMIQAESLRGLKSIRSSQAIKTVLTSLGTLLLLYPLSHMWGANGVVSAFVMATVATSFIAWLLWKRAWKSRCGMSVDLQNGTLKQEVLFRSSWPLFGVALTGLVIQQAATISLGVWGGADDVGVFNVANRVAGLLLFPLMAMISILTPKFAAMHKQGDMEGLAGLARSSSKMLTFFALPVALLVALRAEWILSLFGSEFKSGTTILTILLVGVVINTVTGAVAELLMMSGYEKIVSGGVGISALVTLALCLTLIPKYGQIGAAIALTCGMGLQNLIMIVGVKRMLGFWPVSLARR